MTKLLWRGTGVVIFLLAVLGSVNLGIWVTDREPPITFEGARALTETVAQGGSLDVEFSVFRERICPLVAKRWLYDSNGEQHSILSSPRRRV